MNLREKALNKILDEAKKHYSSEKFQAVKEAVSNLPDSDLFSLHADLFHYAVGEVK